MLLVLITLFIRCLTDILAGDKQLANEIEFDLRKFEEQQAEQTRRAEEERQRRQRASMRRSSTQQVVCVVDGDTVATNTPSLKSVEMCHNRASQILWVSVITRSICACGDNKRTAKM